MYDEDDGQAWHQLMLEKQQWEEENKKASAGTEANLRSPFQSYVQTDDSKADHRKLEEI